MIFVLLNKSKNVHVHFPNLNQNSKQSLMVSACLYTTEFIYNVPNTVSIEAQNTTTLWLAK